MGDLDQQFRALQQRLAAVVSPGIPETNAATDFAIDANAGGRADLTLALLEPLSARVPNVAKIWQLIGLAWRDEQDMVKAGNALAQAAKLAPQDPRIAMGKAQIAFETGQPASALFQRVRQIAPHDGELALSTAAALLHDGKAKDGVALIEALVEQNPVWLRGHAWLAATRWMMGDRQDFDRSFRKAVAAFPKDKTLRIGWYNAVAQPECWDLAERVLAKARREIGQQPEFDAAEAHIATETGNDDRAEQLFAKIDTAHNAGVALSAIRHALRTGRIERAAAVASPWLNTPSAAGFWPYMSTIWRSTGDRRAAWLDGDTAFIRCFDLPLAPGQLEELAQCLRQLHLMCQHPAEQSLRGGTQTQGHLFLRLEPELLAIRTLILDAVRDYVAALPPFVGGHPLLGTARGSLLFEGAWSVRLASQGFHVVHTHPMGWISSAFYVALPDNMGADNAGWLQLGAPPPDLRLDLAPYAMIEPKPGRLALFPSTMWHGTVPFEAENGDRDERLTIAFDIRTPRR
jgi:tetratricopeptide (TPR) repeat protein